jgi:hypothetical protein
MCGANRQTAKQTIKGRRNSSQEDPQALTGRMVDKSTSAGLLLATTALGRQVAATTARSYKEDMGAGTSDGTSACAL